MNRLIRCVISFVLPFFCLLVSVSRAEFTLTPLTNGSSFGASANVASTVCGDYTFSQINSITYNRFTSDDSSYIAVFDTMSASLTEDGFKFMVVKANTEDKYIAFVGNSNISIGGLTDENAKLDLYFTQIDTSVKQSETNRVRRFVVSSSAPYATTVLIDGSPTHGYDRNLDYTIIYSNVDVKQIVYSSGPTWDGTSYYWERSEPEEPEETPTMPTNSEIASAVQAFYNSDYYKNNKDFSDFMVVYNTTNGYFDFVGHTLGNTLGQVIIPPDYRYQGKLYNNQWWKFFIDENQGALPYGSSYYLYSTNDLGQNITYDGIGRISDLLNVDFGSHSVIVYSTTDYPVRTYILDETTGDYTYTDGIIEGNQYTYDENLNPSENGYNPLDNFVTVNPSETIIGDADFGSFTDSFEENKDLFSFTEDMQWLIVANNALSNKFLGFIVMCAMFLTIGRVLRG